jgi:peptidoglycan-N-acetylglucosamine deacetylase
MTTPLGLIRRASLGVVVGGLAAHAAPYVGTLAPVRRAVMPGLAGQGRSGQIALTFDDGPDPVSTPLFLERLRTLGWSATFFVLGDMVRAAPTLTREIVDAGHELAVHADRHRAHFWRRPDQVIEDVRQARDTIAEIGGVDPIWMRPPHGSLAGASFVAARRTGLTPVLWTTWGRDWSPTATPQSVVTNLRRHLCDGGTLLLHDSSCTAVAGSWRSALGALDLLADDVAEHRWSVVALRDHLAVPQSAGRRVRAVS